MRDDWAHSVAIILIGGKYSRWLAVGISFVRQVIEIERVWWHEFTENSEMADIIIKSARGVSLERLKKWVAKQVVPGIFTLQTVIGTDEFWQFVVENINEKRLEKWKPIIELAYKEGT